MSSYKFTEILLHNEKFFDNQISLTEFMVNDFQKADRGHKETNNGHADGAD